MRGPSWPLVAAHLLVALSLEGRAAAEPRPSIFINDVKVEGLRGQRFTSVDVLFDDRGDLRIIAPGYRVTTVDSNSAPALAAAQKAAAATAAAKEGHRFYIATVQPKVGAAQWDIEVHINQVFVKKFRSREAEPLHEITRYLRPGANLIHFTARREEGDLRSHAASDWFELAVGEGTEVKGQMSLQKLTSYRRTAAETGTYNGESTLQVPGP
ncbi:MAG: hypothetical protein EXR72_15140 [Myxococcales bacterium]|nr:hypothetical protein [Myxococcales bacterium]